MVKDFVPLSLFLLEARGVSEVSVWDCERRSCFLCLLVLAAGDEDARSWLDFPAYERSRRPEDDASSSSRVLRLRFLFTTAG